MNLLRFWHVTLQITAVPLTKISMVKPFIDPVHGVSAHLPTLFFSVSHLFPLLSCQESASILQPFR